MEEQSYILQMINVTKQFPGTKALDGVNFDLRRGEVHALVGENGAGKSTLIKIISGVYKPDDGKIVIDGHEYGHLNPRLSMKLGISVVYQEPAFIDTQNVAEALNEDLIARSLLRFVNWKKFEERAREMIKRVNLSVSPREKVSKLSTGQKQLLDFARALSRNPRIIILDEPTSSLSETEVAQLFGLLKKFKREGLSFIYISHKLNEIMEIADRVTVLRDGQVTGRFERDEVDVNKLVESMVGRKLQFKYGSYQEYRKKRLETRRIGGVLLSVKNLACGAKVKRVSFEVREGEILGLYGMLGSGRTEALKCLLGGSNHLKVHISFKGQGKKFHTPYDALVEGIGFVPEDRLNESLIMALPVFENVSFPKLVKSSKFGILGFAKFKEEIGLAESVVKKLSVKLVSVKNSPAVLSGGNQQKVVIGRWLTSETPVLVVDEPTRGIDVGAKEEIYNLLLELARTGTTIILSSSELPEIMMLCDRVVVFRSGETVAEFNVDETTESDILRAATTDSGR